MLIQLNRIASFTSSEEVMDVICHDTTSRVAILTRSHLTMLAIRTPASEDPALLFKIELPTHGRFTCGCFDDPGDRFMCSGERVAVQCINTKTGAIERSIGGAPDGYGQQLLVHRNHLFAPAPREEVSHLLSLDTGELIALLPQSFPAMAIDPTGRLLAHSLFGDTESTLHFMGLNPPFPCYSLSLEPYLYIESLLFSADGTALLMQGADHRDVSLRCYEFPGFKRRWTIDWKADAKYIDGYTARCANRIALLDAGRLVIFADHDGNLVLAAFATGEIVARFRLGDSLVQAFDVMPARGVLAAASERSVTIARVKGISTDNAGPADHRTVDELLAKTRTLPDGFTWCDFDYVQI